MAGVKGKTGKYIRTQETRKRMSLSKLGDKNPMHGKTYTDEEKKKISDGLKGKLPKNWNSLNKSLGGLRSRQVLALRQPTGIEKKVYDYLLLKGVLFESQYLVNGKFLVDAYIPSLNLIIEADGKYWHNMVKGKDKAENAYLTKCGYNLIRLTEEEINSGEFKERLVV